MIHGPSHCIVLATRQVDLRRGRGALAATPAVEFGLDIYSGVIVTFGWKRGDRRVEDLENIGCNALGNPLLRLMKRLLCKMGVTRRRLDNAVSE